MPSFKVLSDFITPLWIAHATELIPTGAEQRRWPIPVNWTSPVWTATTTRPCRLAALLPRYAAGTPFPEAWGGFRCSAWGLSGSTFGPTGRLARRQDRSPRRSRAAV